MPAFPTADEPPAEREIAQSGPCSETEIGRLDHFASPDALDQARRDHVAMIEALRAGRRNDLVELTLLQLKPSPQAYISAYERRFGQV
jgi:hypothetical protein